MKKRVSKLRLHRETLHRLSLNGLEGVAGAATTEAQTACSMIEDSCAICTYGGHTCYSICQFDGGPCHVTLTE